LPGDIRFGNVFDFFGVFPSFDLASCPSSIHIPLAILPVAIQLEIIDPIDSSLQISWNCSESQRNMVYLID
jgi:hypothetical protein